MKKIAVLSTFTVALLLAQTTFAQVNSYPQPYGGASCVSLSRDLSYGTRSSDVSSLQSFLVTQNFPGGGNWMITGFFGKATTQAVKNFQQLQGLAMTGVADNATRQAITRITCGQGVFPQTYPHVSYPFNYNYNNGFNSYSNGSVALTSISQNTGSPGTSVTLYGIGFDQNNTVYFGSQALTGIGSPSGTSITFTIPSYASFYTGNQTVQIYVTNARGTSNPLTFTIALNQSQCGYQYGYSNNCYQYHAPTQNLQAPAITYLSPAQGAVGIAVTVYGTGFSPTGNTVHFGPGIIANLNSGDGQSVSFTIPSQLSGYGSQIVTLSTYQVSVTNASGYTTNTMPFTVTSLGQSVAPSITSVNGPTSLPVGFSGTWTISVNNASNSYLTTSVNWGDASNYAQPQPAVVGNTTLTFTHTYSTAGTKTITFTVTNGAGLSNIASATVNVTSSGVGSVMLSTLNPSAGPVGTTVTLYGSGFTQSNTINFGSGVIANVYSANGTSLSFAIPTYLSPYCAPSTACPMYMQVVTPGMYNVSVQNQNGTSNTLTFQVQ
jgi:hypothetical protein